MPDGSGSSLCKHFCFQVLNRTTLKLFNYSFVESGVFRDRSFLTEPEHTFKSVFSPLRNQIA